MSLIKEKIFIRCRQAREAIQQLPKGVAGLLPAHPGDSDTALTVPSH